MIMEIQVPVRIINLFPFPPNFTHTVLLRCHYLIYLPNVGDQCYLNTKDRYINFFIEGRSLDLMVLSYTYLKRGSLKLHNKQS